MLANRVREFSITVGTGNITLGGAMPGHIRFGDAFTAGDSVIYVVEDGDNYEIGTGTYGAGNMLVRTSVSETLEDGVLTRTGALPVALTGQAKIYSAVTAEFLLDPTEAADVITEVTSGAGVTVDGVLLKDGTVTAGSASFGGDVKIAKSAGNSLVMSETLAASGYAIVRLKTPSYAYEWNVNDATGEVQLYSQTAGTELLTFGNSKNATFTGDINARDGFFRNSVGGRIVLDESDVADASGPIKYLTSIGGELVFGTANRTTAGGTTGSTTLATLSTALFDVKTAMQVAGDVEVGGTILSTNTTGAMLLGSSTTTLTGAILIMYPQTHSTKSNDIEFRRNSSNMLAFVSSQNLWDFQGNSISAGAAAFAGAVSGASFTSGTGAPTNLGFNVSDAGGFYKRGALQLGFVVAGADAAWLDAGQFQLASGVSLIANDATFGTGSGASIQSATSVTLDGSSHHYLTFANTATTEGGILWADPQDNDAAYFVYDHNSQTLRMGAGATQVLTASSALFDVKTAMAVAGDVTQSKVAPLNILADTDTSLGADQVIGGHLFSKADPSRGGAGIVGGMRMLAEGGVGESTYLAFYTSGASLNDVEFMRGNSDLSTTFAGDAAIANIALSSDGQITSQVAGSTSSVKISGGFIPTAGATLQLFASNHATNGNDFLFSSGGINRLFFDSSQSRFDFLGNSLDNVGEATFAGHLNIADAKSIFLSGSTGDYGSLSFGDADPDVMALTYYQNSGRAAAIEFSSSSEAAGDGLLRFMIGNTAAQSFDNARRATFSADLSVAGALSVDGDITIGGTPTGTAAADIHVHGWRTDGDVGRLASFLAYNIQGTGSGVPASGFEFWSTGTADQSEIRVFTHNGSSSLQAATWEADGTLNLEGNDLVGVGSATFAGPITGNDGALLTGSATADARYTFTQTTAGLTGTIQQGSTGFAISALGAQALLLNTNGVLALTLDSNQNATFAGTVKPQVGNAISVLIGADGSGTGLTDSAQKVGRMGTPHYDTAALPSAVFTTDNNASDNILTIGGGTSQMNAATIVRIRTASNTTTATGTTRLEVTSSAINSFLNLNMVGNDLAGVNDFSMAGMVNYGTIDTAIVTANAITVSKRFTRVDTATAAQTVKTINGGTEGDEITVSSSNSANSLTVQDIASGGNLQIAGDFVMNNPADTLTLYSDGTNWIELSRSSNA